MKTPCPLGRPLRSPGSSRSTRGRSFGPWLLCLLLTLVGHGARGADDAGGAPNIIFILADDLGYGDLGCYGQRRLRTPHIDRLAEEGMRFSQFYAGSTVCAPSRCVLMTGYHTGRAFIRGNGKDNLRPEDVTVAEVLRGAGYATGLVGKWGLGHEGSTGLPTRQGFDHFFGYLDQHHAHNYYPSFLVRGEERVRLRNVVPGEGAHGQGVATEKVDYSHDLLVDDALAFVRRHGASRDKPFFLYLALTIPHANNEGRNRGMEVPSHGIWSAEDWPEPEKGFAAMVSRMDTDVGRLMALIDELGIDRRTVVLFSSDNGPHREGGHDPEFFGSRGPLRGIKRDLTEGGIRVPCIARWPGRIRAGAVSHHVGAFQDILPTLAELAGAEEAVPSGIDGLSFVPTLLGRSGDQRPHDHLYWAFYERGGARAIRRGRWKAVQQPMGTPVRLYDLDADVGEIDDIAARQPERVRELTEAMDRAYEPSERWTFPRPRARRADAGRAGAGRAGAGRARRAGAVTGGSPRG